MQKEISYDVEQIVLNACSLLEQGDVIVSVPYIPIEKYREVFEKLGTWDNEFDTNGWDVDFWIYFYINDIKYCLSESWFYGVYSISKD